MIKAKIYYLLFLLAAVALTSCKDPEPARLIRFQSLTIGSMVGNEATIRGEALLYNPNSFGVRIKEIDIEIDIESTKVATLRETKAIKAGAKKQFTVPFEGKFAMADIQRILEKDGLAYLLGKKVPLHFKGEIKTSFGGWGTRIPVDMTEDVNLGKLLAR